MIQKNCCLLLGKITLCGLHKLKESHIIAFIAMWVAWSHLPAFLTWKECGVIAHPLRQLWHLLLAVDVPHDTRHPQHFCWLEPQSLTDLNIQVTLQHSALLPRRARPNGEKMGYHRCTTPCILDPSNRSRFFRTSCGNEFEPWNSMTLELSASIA